MQCLPPKGSKDIGVHMLPRAFMVNQPDTSSRSDMCLSVAGGIQRLRVKIVIGQLDPFGFPLLMPFIYCTFKRTDLTGCQLPWQMSCSVGGISESPFKGPEPSPLISSAGWREKSSRSPCDIAAALFAHLPRQLSSYPSQPAPKSIQITQANSRRTAFLWAFAISDFASLLAATDWWLIVPLFH